MNGFSPKSPDNLEDLRASFARTDAALNRFEGILTRLKASGASADSLSLESPQQEAQPQPLVAAAMPVAPPDPKPSHTPPARHKHFDRRFLVGLLILIIGPVSSSGLTLFRLRGPLVERDLRSDATIFNGKIKPAGQVVLGSPATATIRDVLVKIGEEVVPGQLLLAVDSAAAQDAVDTAELERLAAEQQVAQLERSLRLAERSLADTSMELAQANGRLTRAHSRADQVPTRQWRDSPERAQAAYDHAKLRVERMQRLSAQGLVATQDVDDAETEVRIAQNDLDNARRWAAAAEDVERVEQEQVDLQLQHTQTEYEQQRAERSGQLQQARLRAQEAARRAETARRMMDESGVRSTVAGVVVDVAVKVGDHVAAGTTVVRLVTLKELLVEVPVDASLINTLRVGQRATVSIPTIPPQHVDGDVFTINPIPTVKMTHSVEVRFPNPSGLILSGQPAEVVFRW